MPRQIENRQSPIGNPYGTFSVIVWLFEFVPEAAVTVIVYVPAGVPLGGVWVDPWLHDGRKKSEPSTMQSRNIPAIFFRRRLLPNPPINAQPGTISHSA